MALAHDNTTTHTATMVGATTSTFSHTTTGSNLGLMVAVAYDDVDNITGVTYNGVSMSELVVGEAFATRNIKIYGLAAPASGANDVVLTSNATLAVRAVADSYTDVHQSDAFGVTGTASGDNQTGASQSVTTESANSWIYSAVNYEDANGSVEEDSGQTERGRQTAAPEMVTSDSVTTTTGSYTDGYNWNPVVNQEGVVAMVEIKQAAQATIEQEGFAFGEDDGNEASHTLDTQDTNITDVLGTRTLRTTLNATSNPASTAYKLKYQKDGSGGYTDVPIVSSSGGDDLVIAGSDTTQDGSNTTSASLAVTLPAYSSGDLIVIPIDMWSNGAAKTATWPAGPDGETITEFVDGVGAGTSNTCYISIGYYIATAGYAGGDITVTASATTRWAGAVIVVPAGEFDSDTPLSTQSSTDNSITNDSTPNVPALTASADDGGGLLFAFIAADQDAITGTPTGWTDLETLDQGRASIELAVRDANITDSETTSAATWTIASDAWTTQSFIIRAAPAVNSEVYISASGNVAAGGEATTARLIAPSTKTSGADFDTGRRWDDENGSDSVDITEDDYTELEWVLTTQSPATTDDYFEFRVYAADVALDTYTVTPKWTIGTGATNVTVNPAVQSATFTQLAPTITSDQSVTVSPGAQSATFTNISPTITAQQIVTVSPSVQTGVFSQIDPTVTSSQDAQIDPAVQSATFTNISPTVTPIQNPTVSPAVQSATFTNISPTITAIKSVVVSPAVQTLTASQPSITITVGDGATPAVQSATFTAVSPAITAIKSPTVSLDAQTATFSAISPAVTATGDAATSPDVQTGTFSQPAITVTPVQNVTTSPNVQAGTFSQPSTTITVGDGATPAVQTGTFSQPNPAITTIQNRTVSPDVQVGTFTAISPAVTATADITVSPDAQVATFTTQTATVTTIQNATPTPNAQTGTFTALDPTVSVGEGLSVGVQTATFSQLDPAVTAVSDAVTVLPSVQSLVASQLDPTIDATGLTTVIIALDLGGVLIQI